MPEILAWYFVLLVVGWCCLPLVWRLFRWLPDRGLLVLRPLGLLLTGYVHWIGTASGLLQSNRTGAWIALGLVVGASVLGSRPAWGTTASGTPALLHWLRRKRSLVLASELLFLMVFLGWCWIRAHDPAIDHTEEPMDLMFLSAVLTSPTHPPGDPWLSGFAISYYYFGYWLQGTLALLAARPPEVAYNLAQASWLAMVWSGSFGVVYNLLSLDRRVALPDPEAAGTSGRSGGRRAIEGPGWRPVLGGLLGAFAVAGAANVDATMRGWRRWLSSEVGSEPWWWWQSSRVLTDVGPGGGKIELISEFPAFSFILGDNHPHVLALPLLLIVVALALNLFASRASAAADRAPASPVPGSARRLLRLMARSSQCSAWLTWGVVLIAAAVPLAVNTWNLPLSWILLAGAVLAATGKRGVEARDRPWLRRRVILLDRVGPATLLTLILAVTTPILFLPYLVSAQSQQRGWLPNLFHPTRIEQFLLIFGAFLPALGGLLFQGRWVGGKRLLRVIGLACIGATAVLLAGLGWVALSEEGSQWAEPYSSSGLLRTVLGRWLRQPFTLLLTLILAGAAGIGIASSGASEECETLDGRSSEPAGRRFALGLLTAGLLMLLIPELVYVRDVFESRMNTVFKFYYQAWLLLGLAAAYAVMAARDGAPAVRKLLAGSSLVLMLASLAYPIQAAATKMSRSVAEPTLDGLAHLGPDEREAIGWVRRHVPPAAVVLQAPGDSYRGSQGRLSAATGRATLLGWQGHERQWRGGAYPVLTQGRVEAAATIYRDGDLTAMHEQIERFSIDYIYIGPEERRRYALSPEREKRLLQVADLVFTSGEIQILRSKRNTDRDR